jgi:hypothetical protein
MKMSNKNKIKHFNYFIRIRLRKKFSASFNENNYYMHPCNYENAFSFNYNSNNKNNSTSIYNLIKKIKYFFYNI